MYRIKTDIRQFKCDTREKVEKLIRNWVIRPTDLLYDRDQKRWAPIGDSDEFEPIFEQVKESSEDDEKTIVTSHEDSPAVLLNAQEEYLDEDEATAARARPAAAVLRPSKNVARKGTPDPLPIPEAPEGVEPVVLSHEVTVMTERTADLLGLRDSDEHLLEEITPDEPDEPEEDSEPQLTRGDLPEELFLTNELSAPLPILAPKNVVLDELGDAGSVDEGWDSLQDLDEDSAFDEDDRATIELDIADIKLEDRRRQLARDEDDEVTVLTRAPVSSAISEPDEGPKEPSSTVFVDASYGTDEPDALQDEPLLDEPLLDGLSDLPAPVSPARRELPKLTAPLPRSVSLEGIDDLDDLDDLPAPVEPALKTSSDPGDDLPAPVIDLPAPVAALSAPVIDLPAPVAALSAPPASELESSSEPMESIDDTPELTSDAEVASDLELASEASSPDDATDDATDDVQLELHEPSAPTDDPFDEDALEEVEVEPVDEAAFEDLLEGDEPEAASFVQDRSFVSEGYTLDLPFEVAPTAEDIAAGVKRSSATLAQKDRAFPYPKPKTIGEVQLRHYGNTPDYSLFYVGVGVLVFILLIVTIAILMSLG